MQARCRESCGSLAQNPEATHCRSGFAVLFLSTLHRGFFWTAVGGMPAFAASLGCKGVIARKAALAGVYALTAFPACLGRQPRVLREAALFMRHALAAFARDRPLFLGIH
jgi:hypothetical protein